MTPIGFVKLMRMIFGKKLPDLNKIQDMGLLAVKISQHFALRIDFLDEKVCHHLSQLFRSTHPAKEDDLKKLLADRVDTGWFDNFEHIDQKPFASASVGQVHFAQLKSGESVVVKIIKEDFKEQFLKDIRSLRKMIMFSVVIMPKLKKVFNPLAILDHIESYTINELDLLNEIEGRDRLMEIRERYVKGYDLSRLSFPKVYPHLSNSTVLVSEQIVGKTFDELLQSGDLSYDELLQLFSVHGVFLFGAGVFHGDLHPGNVILQDNNDIVFIDNGAVSRTNQKIRESLFNFFITLSAQNYSEAAINIVKMSESEISDKATVAFTSEFLDLYKDFAGSTVSEVSLTKKMMDTIKLGINFGLSFDEQMFAIIKSLMYLDGMVLSCNPKAVLLSDMVPYIDKLNGVLEISDES